MNAIQKLPCSPACKESAEKDLESTVCGPQASVEAPEGLQHFHTRYVSPVSSPWLDDSFVFPTQAPADLAISVTSHTRSYAMLLSGAYGGPWLQVLVCPKHINCRGSLCLYSLGDPFQDDIRRSARSTSFAETSVRCARQFYCFGHVRPTATVNKTTIPCRDAPISFLAISQQLVQVVSQFCLLYSLQTRSKGHNSRGEFQKMAPCMHAIMARPHRHHSPDKTGGPLQPPWPLDPISQLNQSSLELILEKRDPPHSARVLSNS